MFLVELSLKAIPTSTFGVGHLNISLESPSVPFNPLDGDTKTYVFGQGQEHFISSLFMVFIGPDVQQNGIEAFLQSYGTDVNIYDYSFKICKLYSNSGN
jgi:hypothetical protein